MTEAKATRSTCTRCEHVEEYDPPVPISEMLADMEAHDAANHPPVAADTEVVRANCPQCDHTMKFDPPVPLAMATVAMEMHGRLAHSPEVEAVITTAHETDTLDDELDAAAVMPKVHTGPISEMCAECPPPRPDTPDTTSVVYWDERRDAAYRHLIEHTTHDLHVWICDLMASSLAYMGQTMHDRAVDALRR